MQPKLSELLALLFTVLVHYEIELTAYQTVYQAVEIEAVKAGSPMNIAHALSGIVHDGRALAEATALWKPIREESEHPSEENIQRAIQAVRQRIAQQSAPPSPPPLAS